MEVLDKFLPDNEFIPLQEFLLKGEFPWYFNSTVSEPDTTEELDCYFTHTFYKDDASNIATVKKYESYNDPGIDINPEITSLTGISNDMVKDKSINWDYVKEILDSSQLIIAHNARFDKAGTGTSMSVMGHSSSQYVIQNPSSNSI